MPYLSTVPSEFLQIPIMLEYGFKAVLLLDQRTFQYTVGLCEEQACQFLYGRVMREWFRKLDLPYVGTSPTGSRFKRDRLYSVAVLNAAWANEAARLASYEAARLASYVGE